MKYSSVIGIESFFDSTFNMTEERENYWKQFITNEKFESNLKEIVNAFTSPSSDQHKSIWVQGTYGTGKSHSTSVIKHLLCDNVEDIVSNGLSIGELTKLISDNRFVTRINGLRYHCNTIVKRVKIMKTNKNIKQKNLVTS